MVYIPSTSKPWQPLSEQQRHHPPARTTPKRRQGPDFGSSKQGMNRTAVNHPASPCLLRGFGAWGLVSRQAAAPGHHQLMSGCPCFRTGQSTQANQRHLRAGVNTSCPLPVCHPSDHRQSASPVLAPGLPKPVLPSCLFPAPDLAEHRVSQAAGSQSVCRPHTHKGLDSVPSTYKKDSLEPCPPKS